MTPTDDVDPKLDLVLERHIPDVSPDLLWRAWTEPDQLMQWFAPRPWTTVACEIDLRPGGVFSATMRSPEGEDMKGAPGCYLEVVEERRLVWTDALGPGYRPNPSPFMTAIITMAPAGSGTSYRALVRHHDEAARQTHEEMGFFTGWATVLDQLVAHARGLPRRDE